MKTWKHFTVVVILAIFGIVFIFTACDDGNGNKITREFTITGFVKDIKVIDTRTGSNDIDLEKLGVISRLTAGLNAQTSQAFATVIDRGLIIQIEETLDQEFKIYSGNRLGIKFSYISSDDQYLTPKIAGMVANMADM